MEFKQDEKGIFKLTKRQMDYLNSLDSVKKFPKELKPSSPSKKIKIVYNRQLGGNGAVATEDIFKGEVICLSDGSRLNKPIKYSWQISKNIHVIGLGALNHNCQNPNIYLNNKNQMVALKEIKQGQFLFFNYLTTEFNMNKPFICKCGEKRCFGEIKGWKHLLREQKKYMIKNFKLSSYIHSIRRK